ncbi:acetyl-CoA synthetase-like protein [Trametopsis cervina]|nr:acetyl-CoA synthetase-like protein [Trametopsis cervina]
MTSQKPLPPLDGSITPILGTIDWQAQHNPDLPCIQWPSADSPMRLGSVTNAQYVEATHRIANILRPGKRGQDGDKIAILIHTDTLLYGAILAGCMRAGLTPFPMSPRNSGPAVCNMMEKTGTHRILSDSHTSALIAEVLEELSEKSYAAEVTEMPGLFDAFPSLAPGSSERAVAPVEPYPYEEPKSFEDILLIVHSSGSTGFPKPISWSHQYYLNAMRCSVALYAREHGTKWFVGALPPFHAYALGWQMALPWISGVPGSHYAPQYPAPPVNPTPDNNLLACQLTGCNAVPAVPAFVETWSRSEQAVEYLKSLDILLFAGGPLSTKCGDELAAAGVKISSIYAGTEFGAATDPFYPKEPGEFDRTPLDWEWLRFNPRFNVRWVPQGDGSFECQFMACDTHVPAVNNLGDLNGYSTSDLFIPHPTKKGLWKICGRADDVIVLKTAEKIVPLAQEGHVLSSPLVKGAIMFGRGRDEAGILIEPKEEYQFDPTDEQALVDFRNKIWPIVEEANRKAPAFAKIFKEMIIVTDPKRPFPRAAKGTLLKKQLLALYETDIDRLYETVENSTNVKDTKPPRSWDLEDVEDWLLEVASAVNDTPITASEDIFQQGYDSLSATFLRARIVAALRMTKQVEASQHVSQNFIFDHPTIEQLASSIHALVNPEADTKDLTSDHLQQVRDMIAKYTDNLPAARVSRGRRSHSKAIVLLTGSTGNLGAHILAALLRDSRVSKVYTLDRPSSETPVATRLASAFEDRGLPVDLLSSDKLVPLAGNLSAENFGLVGEVFNELKNSLTDVIHNAWAVHFSYGLSHFENLIAGTRKLVDLALGLDRSVRVLFTSSIATVGNWNPVDGPVPEEFLPESAMDPNSGYSSSKYVVEQMFEKARLRGLDAVALRVGQLCGSSTTGAWNTTDWVPILVKSSIALGAFPDTSGPVNWIAMDSVADAVLDLVFSEEEPAGLLNVVHPKTVSWRETLEGVNKALGVTLPFIPFGDWVARVQARSSDASPQTLDAIPAIKLLDFFGGVAARSKEAASHGISADALGVAMLQTTKLQQYSASVRALPPLGEQHAKMWIAYWKAKNFL